MQYFASILAYTGAIAGIQRKKKGNDQDLTKYLINDCSSSGLCVYAFSLWSTNCVVPTPPPPPPAGRKKNGHRVACASAEMV